MFTTFAISLTVLSLVALNIPNVSGSTEAVNGSTEAETESPEVSDEAQAKETKSNDPLVNQILYYEVISCFHLENA